MNRLWIVFLILGLVLVSCNKQTVAPSANLPNGIPTTEGIPPSSLQTRTIIPTLTPEEKTPEQVGLSPQPSTTPPSLTKTPIPSLTASPTHTPFPTFTPSPTNTPLPTLAPSPTVTQIIFPDYPIDGIQPANYTSQIRIEQIQEAGAYWTHFTALEWDRIEPSEEYPPQYYWNTTLESMMRLTKENNLSLVAVVQFAPHWAQQIPDSACGPIAESALERFALFMYEAVLRYSQPPYEVKYWEIGNEIDVLPSQVSSRSGYGCWGNRDSPFYGGEYYAEMLKVVYPQIKAADPEAQVLVGGLLMDCDPDNPPTNKDCTPSRFIEGILMNDGGNYFDGISFHAYDYYQADPVTYYNPNWVAARETSGPALNNKTAYLKAMLEKYDHPEKYLMLTEVALICGRTGKEAACVTEQAKMTKASYAVHALVSARAQGIRSAIWYCLEGWRGSGLLEGRTGTHTAYQSFQYAAAFLADAGFVRKIDQFPGAFIYEFQKAGKRYWIAWTGSSEEQIIPMADIPATILNMFGEFLETNDSLALTTSPVYIEW